MTMRRFTQLKRYVKLEKISQTCFACPTQFEGKTDNGDYLYCRYRYGWMSIELNGKELMDVKYGDEWAGCCSWEDFVKQANRNGIIIDDSNAEYLDDEEGIWND
ncbi:hypothetical protein BigBertha_40 [Bacillus phage BigBertha]|uniref:Uncharacterized protein n=1 Tax=Bacillus phage BigBertha TaxID=1406781 RepID=U5PVT6_9CAUD|nr:hypothetical protein BigBertha_40 [Bacillus phage BigBertha]AGY46548.1 hypothetical protein BigBertha_40 [Bacillus phage BigBertha]